MLARAVARVIGVPLRAWHRFWEVDATALAQLPRLEDYYARLDAAQEKNRLLRRAAMSNYAKKHIMPRISMGQDLWPSLAARTNGGGLCVLLRLSLLAMLGKSLSLHLLEKVPFSTFFLNATLKLSIAHARAKRNPLRYFSGQLAH